MRNLTYITLLLLCTITFTGQSADTPDAFDSLLDNWVNTLPPPDTAFFSVEVNVKSDDENTKPLIESYLKRELRSLQDVKIVVDTGNNFIIDIVAIEMEYKVSGNKTGEMAYAYRFSKQPTGDDFPDLRDYFRENMEKIPFKARLDFLRIFTLNEHHIMGIRYFKTNDLKREFEELVAKFDTSVLEPNRNRK